jgi:hypothetical protein
MRITIDHVRFCAERVRAAMREQAGQLELPTIEGSTFFVTLRYPLGWPEKGAETPADEAIADELAIRTGQRIAYLMMDVARDRHLVRLVHRARPFGAALVVHVG